MYASQHLEFNDLNKTERREQDTSSRISLFF